MTSSPPTYMSFGGCCSNQKEEGDPLETKPMEMADLRNNNNKNNIDEPRICRICLETEADHATTTSSSDELIAPCSCRGSQQWVHRTCLDHWRASNSNPIAFSQCTECLASYHLKYVGPEAGRCTFYLYIIRDILLSVLGFASFTLSLGWLLWTCFAARSYVYRNGGSNNSSTNNDAVDTMTLAGITLVTNNNEGQLLLAYFVAGLVMVLILLGVGGVVLFATNEFSWEQTVSQLRGTSSPDTNNQNQGNINETNHRNHNFYDTEAPASFQMERNYDSTNRGANNDYSQRRHHQRQQRRQARDSEFYDGRPAHSCCDTCVYYPLYDCGDTCCYCFSGSQESGGCCCGGGGACGDDAGCCGCCHENAAASNFNDCNDCCSCCDEDCNLHCRDCHCPNDCGGSDNPCGVCLLLLALVLAAIGLVVGVFLSLWWIQAVIERHVFRLHRQRLTQNYVVQDLSSSSSQPKPSSPPLPKNHFNHEAQLPPPMPPPRDTKTKLDPLPPPLPPPSSSETQLLSGSQDHLPHASYLKKLGLIDDSTTK